jgi:Flp pilus assembly pilin Flp
MLNALNAVVIRGQNAWHALRDEEEGQTLVEYALIIAIVALGSIVALGVLSGKITDIFNRAGNELNNVPNS